MLDRREFLAGAGAMALCAPYAAPAQPGATPAARAAARLLDGAADRIMAESPESATILGLDTGARAGLRGRLTDRSPAGVAGRAAGCAERLRALKAIDQRPLVELDAITLKTTIRAHELAAEGYRFPYGDNNVLDLLQASSTTPYVVSQGTGAFARTLDFLDSQHPIGTAADADAYLARLSALAKGLDGETERLRRDAALGVIAPNYLLDTTIRQQAAYRARPIAGWGLVTSLATRAAGRGLAGDWAGRATALCTAEVGPALDRQIAALRDLRARATHDAGCWKLPDGEAYYRWLLRANTTTAMTPDDIHALGIDEVRRIGAEMNRLLVAQGLTRGTVAERMGALGRDKRFLFPNTDAGRAQLLAYLNGVIARVRTKLPQAFATLPRADLVIRRVPIDIEAGAPDGYEMDGPLDGSRPATYFVNLRDTGIWPRFSLPTLCFHEGLPGHVLQGIFDHRLPTIRSLSVSNAYVEGWALYAEQLGDELGMYADDPFGRLGYLQSVQFRACRLVVDTGLHARRWTREQAIRWMVDNNGNPEDAARAEIDRYCAWPGQACGYQIGHREIERQRTKARQALGPRFDVRLFNDAVLASGSVPLDLLDDIVDGHIAARR